MHLRGPPERQVERERRRPIDRYQTMGIFQEIVRGATNVYDVLSGDADRRNGPTAKDHRVADKHDGSYAHATQFIDRGGHPSGRSVGAGFAPRTTRDGSRARGPRVEAAEGMYRNEDGRA